MQPDIIKQLQTSDDVVNLIGLEPIKAFSSDVPDYMQDETGEAVAVKPPYVLLEWAGGTPYKTLKGRTGTARAFFQVTVTALSDTDSNDLWNAVDACLGDACYEDWGDMFVKESSLGLPTDVSQRPTGGEASGLYQLAGRLSVIADYGNS